MITDTREDIRKKHKETYVFLTINGKETLVFMDEDDDRGMFSFYSPSLGNLLLDELTVRSTLQVRFPKTGLYNLDGTAVDFTRLPERQWKRSPGTSNTKLVPIGDKIGIGTGKRFHINQSIAEDLFDPRYPPNIQEALDYLDNFASIALSPRFAISVNSKKDAPPVFWYRTTPIGLIDEKSKSIMIKYEYLRQEAQDFLRKKEPEWNLT